MNTTPLRPLGAAAILLIVALGGSPASEAATPGCVLLTTDWSQPISFIASTMNVSGLNCSADDWQYAALQLTYNHMRLPATGGSLEQDIEATIGSELSGQTALDGSWGQGHAYAYDADSDEQSLVFLAGRPGQSFIIAEAFAIGAPEGEIDAVAYYITGGGGGGIGILTAPSLQSDVFRFNTPRADMLDVSARDAVDVRFFCLACTTPETSFVDYSLPAQGTSMAQPLKFGLTWGSRTPVFTPPGVTTKDIPITITIHRQQPTAYETTPCLEVSGALTLNTCLVFPVVGTFTSYTGVLYDPGVTYPGSPTIHLCTGGTITLTVFGFGTTNRPLPPMPCITIV